MSQASAVLPGPDGAGNAVALSLDDLNTTINHEPRVSHLVVATRLGTRQQETARLIERNRAELEGYGDICVTATQNTDARGRGRPGREYWLSEGQALVVCALSRTPAAAAVRRVLIDVFLAFRRGQIAPPSPERLPPHPRAVPRKDGRYLVVVCGGRISEVKDVRDACIVNGADPMNVRTFLREYVSVEVLPVAMEMIASRTAVALHQHLTGSPFAKRSGRP